MRTPITDVSKTLQSAYDEQYTDNMTEWREIGGKHKAANILSVCKNESFTKVLECGAGEGSILKFLDESNQFPELFATEISDSGISQILKRKLPKLKEVKKFNGYEMPYSNNEFDMAYCSHVLEHVEHPRILLRELKRVSRFQVFEVPLDYSIGVDRNVNHFLSYGHINIFTPSLFRFLLKSEGYEILNQLLTHLGNDVRKFIWYNNMGLERTWRRELSLKLYNIRKSLKSLLRRKSRHEEYGFSAYTCLAKGAGDLKIL